jgi:hypothetical protein
MDVHAPCRAGLITARHRGACSAHGARRLNSNLPAPPRIEMMRYRRSRLLAGVITAATADGLCVETAAAASCVWIGGSAPRK